MTARPPAPARQRWLVPVLVVVLSVTVGSGLLARELYRRPAAPPDDPVASTPTTSVSSGDQPGPGQVEVTEDAARHPQDDVVRQVLQMYFDGVNNHDYDQWAQSVSEGRLKAYPEDKWRKGFVSTKDGSILLYRIEPGAGTSLRVLVGFNSTQSLDEAPPDFQYKCIRWRLVLPMVYERGGYKIDAIQSGASPEHDRC
ncbi:hypothetical protein [Amycolatopsis sp. NPDC051903]|uniref:hypothetical protein n=1 Tax=Amycolatopsis sp. NPDC051903 TaxID=3363936 RepID=UPI0037A5C29A